MAGKRERGLAALLLDPAVYPVNLTLTFEAVFDGGPRPAFPPFMPVVPPPANPLTRAPARPLTQAPRRWPSTPTRRCDRGAIMAGGGVAAWRAGALTRRVQRCYLHYEFLPPQDQRICPCDLVVHRASVRAHTPH